jgi:hypothetical protein
LGSPNQNSKTGLNGLHKLYTIKSVSNAPVEYGKSGITQTDRYYDTLSLRATALRLRGNLNLKNEIASSFAKLTPRNDIQMSFL